MNITRISIERPTLLTVIYSLIIFFGIAAYLMLNYELVPKFNPPVITVVTVYPGATPQEVESEVTLPIEDALSSIENIDNLTSTSSANFSLVKLELVAGADVTYALEDAARNLETVRNDIAEGARQPLLTRFDFDDLPIIRMSLSADMGVVELTDFCNETIIPGLNQLEGVAEVSLLGGMEKELLVNLDQQRMRLLNVSILQVLKAIGSANADVPAGYLESESNRIPLTVSGKFKSLDDLRDLVVFELPAAGIFVRLSDIAEVRENTTERSVVSRLDGKASMGLNIKKQSEANAVEVSKLVVAKLSELENQYNHINLSTQFIQDSSQFTIKAANAVMEDLLLAILLVSLVMLVFLHSIRNALIVFVSIPTSIITTFLVMYLLGYSLNMLTLLGLSLAIGILVDDSIVIIENIHRHLEMGKSARKAAFEGRMEIGFTAISITLIDFVVYFPIILSTGMVPDLLRQFSVVIVASTIMSLFVSFTIAPYLASRFGHAEKNSKVTWLHKFGIKLDNMLNRLIDQLLKVLHRAYRHAGLVLFLSFVLFMGSILLIPFGFIGIEFTKAGDRSEFIIELELPGETPLSRTDSVSKVAESIIMGYPDVEAVYSNVGLTSSGRIVSNTTHLAELYVKLINKEERNYKTSLFARHIKYRLMESIPGLIARPVEINLIGLRDDDAVQITVSGNNKEKVYQVADAINDSLQIIQGAIEIKNSFNPGNRQIQVTPDRKTMDLLGINPAHVGLTIRTAFNGHKEFVFKKGEKQYDINIILDKNDRKSILDVKRLNVINQDGKTIPVGNFAEVEEVFVQGTLERTNRAPSVTIKSQVIGRPAGNVANELRNKIEPLTKQEEVRFIWGGASKRTIDGLLSMITAFAISILLVYLVLVALYDSYYYPFIVLFSIPLAIIGALLLLALTKQSLSIFTILGLIMLVGLVGKNAILVIDFTNKLRKEGLGLIRALNTSIRLRFRPILMTNLTMVIGLLPIALASGAGSEWKNGLAWAIIGGLSSSMFLTLLVVPVVYVSLDKIKSRFLVKRT